MIDPDNILLGLNVDHVATLRQTRGTYYPSPVDFAIYAEEAGADGITIHLREDRRHIQEHDVWSIKERLQTRMNLEMAATNEMLKIALKHKPNYVCIVPEKRSEVTTEGGLNINRKKFEVIIFHTQGTKKSVMKNEINNTANKVINLSNKINEQHIPRLLAK